ncbi:MAG: polar amino acid transport system substrate-binding protein, partial [Gammaproteobacteria bacterium]|nr:polar amino acid transport system substrate-binding protein [Gammaproteobacteria bacterium]
LPIGFVAAVLLSAGVVQILRESTEPVPIIEQGPTAIFIDRPIRLQWNYERPSSAFEIQSSKYATFSQDVVPEGHWIGNFVEIERKVNGVRYWRVRAVNSDYEKISGWSHPVKITHYETTLARIKKTAYVNVYMSDSFNEAFFKFAAKGTKGPPRGYDVAIIDEIVKRLPARLGIDKPLTHRPIHVPWDKLLSTPKNGDADTIISTITMTDAREVRYSIKFSKPYYCTTHSVIYRPPISTQTLREMIANKRVGVQSGTTSEDLLRQFIKEDESIKLVSERQATGMGADILSNKIDYAITDTDFALEEKRKHGAKLEVRKLIFEGDFPRDTKLERVQKYALAVRAEDDELIQAINTIIDEMIRTKTLGALLQGAVKEFHTDPANAPVIDITKDPSEC